MPDYYRSEDLPRFSDIGKEAGELWRKFNDWYGAVFEDGALTTREKALIALGVAHAISVPTVLTPTRRSVPRTAPTPSR